MMKKRRVGTGQAALVCLLVSGILLPAAGAENESAKTVLTIKGMTCGGCVATVKHRLKRVKGVTAYGVSLEKGEAEVTYDPALTGPDAIAAAVSETGFKATIKAAGKEDSQGGKGRAANASPGQP